MIVSGFLSFNIRYNLKSFNEFRGISIFSTKFIIFLVLLFTMSGCTHNITTKEAELLMPELRAKSRLSIFNFTGPSIEILSINKKEASPFNLTEVTSGFHTVIYCTERHIGPYIIKPITSYLDCIAKGEVKFFAKPGHHYKFHNRSLTSWCVVLFDLTTGEKILEDCPYRYRNGKKQEKHLTSP